MKCIIAINNRNTKNKNKTKKRYLTKDEKNMYKNIVKVEHSFGIIKRHLKINNFYRKTLGRFYFEKLDSNFN